MDAISRKQVLETCGQFRRIGTGWKHFPDDIWDPHSSLTHICDCSFANGAQRKGVVQQRRDIWTSVHAGTVSVFQTATIVQAARVGGAKKRWTFYCVENRFQRTYCRADKCVAAHDNLAVKVVPSPHFEGERLCSIRLFVPESKIA
jgi:hypothetical protein